MNKKELIKLLKNLSIKYLNGKVNGNLYAKITESLVIEHLDIVPELEDFADFLAQYHSPKDNPELYGDEELEEQIVKLFKIKKNETKKFKESNHD